MAFRPDPKAGKREKAPRKPLRSRPKPAATEAEREARLRFKTLVLALDAGCVFHDNPADCEPPFQAHHVVTQQQLRAAGRDDLLWDPMNGATVCEKAHRRHTLAVERLPLACLPARCIEFAKKHGFEAVLDRFYDPPICTS